MGQKILTVDDNEIVGWTLAARLWSAGYDVQTVCSASEAFDALAMETYDLVLMDLDMPDMNGLEALDVMVKEQMCPGVPIVLLTASDDVVNLGQAHALGAQGYLNKDAANTMLIPTVNRLLKAGDVVWMDDQHCVSKPARARSRTSDPGGR